MTSKELSKYIGKYVSFDIDDLAYLPLPEIVEGKDLRDNNYHFEGILCTNTGTRSHFSLDTELGAENIIAESPNHMTVIYEEENLLGCSMEVRIDEIH